MRDILGREGERVMRESEEEGMGRGKSDGCNYHAHFFEISSL